MGKLTEEQTKVLEALKALPTDQDRLIIVNSFCNVCGRYHADDLEACKCMG